MTEYTLDTYNFESIQTKALEEFKRKLFCANTAGNLGEFLEKCELDSTLTSYQDITEEEQEKYSLKPQYVLIAGDNVFHQKEEIYKRFKKYGIPRDEVNLDYIGYKKFKNKHSIEELFAYKQDKYKVILIGETPHKAKGIEDFSSLVTCMESNRLKYPKVERLEANLKLKYTHEALERKLKSIVEEEQNRQPTDIYVLIVGDNAFHKKEEIYKKLEEYGIPRDKVNLDYIGYKKFKEEPFAYKQDKYKFILFDETPYTARCIEYFSCLDTCMESNRIDETLFKGSRKASPQDFIDKYKEFNSKNKKTI